MAKFKSDFDRRINTAKTSGDWIDAYELLNGMIKTIDGLTDATIYKKQLADIVTTSGYKNALDIQLQLQQSEIKQQQEFSEQFTIQNEKWWAIKIAELNQRIHSPKTQQESQMNKRLVNFIGFLGYINSNHALNLGDLTNALHYLKVFKMADPKNPDCSYLTAIYYMKEGNKLKAIFSLNEAALLGYSDISQLNTDPVFSSLHDDAGFKKLVNKVTENYSSK